MSKKPSKGSRPPKSTPAAAQTVPAPQPPPDRSSAADAPPQLARVLRLGRQWFPLAGIAVSIILGFTNGIAVAVLALAATAMLTSVAAIWASLQVLAGDRPESLGGALQLMTSGGESEQKAYLLRALKDLEFERSLGKISDQDYAELKQRYRARAKEVLQELDKRNEAARAEAERMARDWLGSRGFAPLESDATPRPGKTAEAAEEGKPAIAHGARRTCASCGTDNDTDARFCKKCGSAMQDRDVDESAARSEEA